MSLSIQNKITFLLSIFVLQISYSQKKDENIGTEVVNVVKPYTPTISDAFKVKDTPSLDDDETAKKETINYSIFSFPVASTFTPNKGKAAGVDKAAAEELYRNYATLGVGNYLNILGELYITQDITETSYFGAQLKHLSSQGGIKDLLIDDKFMNNLIDLSYGNRNQDLSWTANLGFEQKSNFWYGLPSDFGNLLTQTDKDKAIGDINSNNSFSNIFAGSKLTFDNSIVDALKLDFNHFSDKFSSSENNLKLAPKMSFKVSDLNINTNFLVDYLSGSFEKDYSNTVGIKYGYTNLGFAPSFAMNQDNWAFNLGINTVYSMDSEAKESKFFIYPNIQAKLNVVENIMVFYAGAEGNLQQNTYKDFINQNPFLSPTQYIGPTDKQFDVYGGLKGKLSSNLSYNLKASIVSEKGKALFKSNPYDETTITQPIYQYGNSFEVVYDNMKTLGFFGEIKADFSKDFSLAINTTINKYTNDVEAEPWNLPTFKLGSHADFNITEKWYAGADVFFVGDRKDELRKTNIIPIMPLEPVIVTLKSYVDANAFVGYKYSNRLTGFLRGNNLLNQGYQKWQNFPVQSLQVMLGASYKFDF